MFIILYVDIVHTMKEKKKTTIQAKPLSTFAG